MVDRILSLIGLLFGIVRSIFFLQKIILQVQGTYVDTINVHNTKTIAITNGAGRSGGDSDNSGCHVQKVLDVRTLYKGSNTDGSAGEIEAAITNASSVLVDKNTIETNAHIYNEQYQKNIAQNVLYKTLNSKNTDSNVSIASALPLNKGEILIHRPAAVIVKRPPTKVIVNHPPLVVKPPPVVLHKPPAVVVRKVYVKEHPRPVKVEPVYVNVVKPPAKKYFINEKQQFNLSHKRDQLQQHKYQFQGQLPSTDMSYVSIPITASANSNSNLHESASSALQHDNSYHHIISADGSQSDRLLHFGNNAGVSYVTPSFLASPVVEHAAASSY